MQLDDSHLSSEEILYLRDDLQCIPIRFNNSYRASRLSLRAQGGDISITVPLNHPYDADIKKFILANTRWIIKHHHPLDNLPSPTSVPPTSTTPSPQEPPPLLLTPEGRPQFLGNEKKGFNLDFSRFQTENLLSLWIGEQIIPIPVRYSKRARNYRLNVTGKNVTAIVPQKKETISDKERIEQMRILRLLILDATSWILKQLNKKGKKNKPNPPFPIPSPCHPGDRFLFNGEWIPFVFASEDQNSKKGCFRLGQDFSIKLPLGIPDYFSILQKVIKFYAEQVFPPRLRQWAEKMQISYTSLSIRCIRSKWGSCREGNSITLNSQLIHAPLWIQDYVMIHELSHCRQMNHSSQFWTIVASFCPRYKEARKWLREQIML